MNRGAMFDNLLSKRARETRSERTERTTTRNGVGFTARGETTRTREIDASNADGLRLIICEERSGYVAYPSSLSAAFEEERFSNAPFFRLKSS
jgi:hypothetical protein